jgi:hypothetical protein
VIGDCFVQGGVAHGTVLVRSDSPTPHTFTVNVRLGTQADPVAVDTVRVPAQPGQIGQAIVNAPTSTPDGTVQCAVLSIQDETGATPVAGDPLPPPSDSQPMPAQPSPGEPSVSLSPPTLVTPGPTRS